MAERRTVDANVAGSTPVVRPGDIYFPSGFMALG